MEYIKIPDLEDGWVYRIKSRNLSCGVWNKNSRGFTGIREKFGDEYLFEEYHYDEPAFATARPLYAVVKLPSWIPRNERMSLSQSTGRPTIFVPDDGLKPPGKWYDWITGDLLEKNDSCGFTNRWLFDFLKPLSDQFNKEDYDDYFNSLSPESQQYEIERRKRIDNE